jgi:hypothetical protein
MDEKRPDLPYIQPHPIPRAMAAPAHRFGVTVGVAVALVVVGFLFARAIAPPNTVINQRFEAPVNAAVTNTVRTDQQVEMRAEVQP